MTKQIDANGTDDFFQLCLAEIKPKSLREVVRNFYTEAAVFLIGKGAIDCLATRDTHQRFSLNTVLGEYRLSFSPHHILCSIHGRFERENAGYVFTKDSANHSNQFSGKWNHNYDTTLDSLQSYAMQDFQFWINKLVDFKPTKDFWAEVVRREIERDQRKRERAFA